MSLQSHFLRQERLGSSPLFPCYTQLQNKGWQGSFFQDSSNKGSANQYLLTSYLNWNMWSVMQEFNATRDHQHLERRLQPYTDPAAALSTQFHPLPFLFCILFAAVCSYPWAVTLWLLAQLSRIAGNKSKASYSLLAPGFLVPRMGRLQDIQKSRKLRRDRKNSIPQGRRECFWSHFGDLGSKIFKGCWHHQQQFKLFLRTAH